MAALGSPLQTLRGLLRELRHASGRAGRPYRHTPAYRHIVAAFRAHRVRAGSPHPPLSPSCLLPLVEARRGGGAPARGRAAQRGSPWPRGEVKPPGLVPSSRQVTSEKLCRAQQELHFQAATYLCLLRSVREHTALHQEYHGKGERSPEEVAGLLTLKVEQDPGCGRLELILVTVIEGFWALGGNTMVKKGIVTKCRT
ncbi:hypothetical protein QYF61_005152 [Mycteria americana]|uniref:Protein FMC1 homolog n=1 Tax=Mycteria americana TaxID=33587 RepID=A0AAN7NLB3_MYCAM|nr:hypothetical protein QYF61_005152 [Mycteria americana]